MQEKYFKTASGTVTYWVSREPDPAQPWLVFLPGLTADHTLFTPQVEYFRKKVNCFVWDAPAHGASRPYKLNFSLGSMALMLHSIFTRESIERPILIGQSFGGYLSQMYMELFPGEAIGFISIDSAPLQRSYYTKAELKALRHTKLMYKSFPWGRLKKIAAKGVAYTEMGQANMLAMMRRYEKAEYNELASYGYRLLADAVEAERPYLITVPALIMCGEFDKAASTKRYNEMWGDIGGMALAWIPDAGHNATVDNPRYVNEKIEWFYEIVLDREEGVQPDAPEPEQASDGSGGAPQTEEG